MLKERIVITARIIKSIKNPVSLNNTVEEILKKPKQYSMIIPQIVKR